MCLGVFVKQEWGHISCIPTPHSFRGKGTTLEAARSPMVPGLEGGWVAVGPGQRDARLRKRQAPSLSGPSLSPPDPGTGPSW